MRLYGTDARNIQVTEHNGVPDLWTGFATSPVALTLRHKNAYLDLTGADEALAGERARRTSTSLHPVVKLADGTLLAGSQTFSSPQRPMVGSNAFSGNFVVSEVTFDDQRWFQLDPVKVVTLKEVGNPDLSRVDEIGFVDLMPGGGHGFAGCSNVSWIEGGAASPAQALSAGVLETPADVGADGGMRGDSRRRRRGCHALGSSSSSGVPAVLAVDRDCLSAWRAG